MCTLLCVCVCHQYNYVCGVDLYLATTCLNHYKIISISHRLQLLRVGD